MNNSSNQVGLCSMVVLDLMAGLEHTGLHLYTDNYYTSPLLYNHLYNRGINACGTARVNRRHFPKELETVCTRVNRGYYDYLSSGPLLACVWVEKRTIYFLSTLHIAEAPIGNPCTVSRLQLDGTRSDVTCPPCLPDYQENMRGVDRADQLGSYYKVGRRSRKWWKRVFAYGIECSISNAYVLDKFAKPIEHARSGRSKRDYFAFRYELANGLLGGFRSRQLPGRPRSYEHTQLDRLNLTMGH